MEIPGFVDLQVNGYRGVDFSGPDLTPERFLFASKALLRNGTAVFLPTIITSPEPIFKRNLRLMSEVIRQHDLDRYIPGFHIEGPFISADDGARGAHNREWVIKPDRAFLDRLMKWSDGKIKLLTLAAETEGAAGVCRHAVSQGITVSLGHQMATETDLQKLVQAGARSLTHLGNGMPRVIPRFENALWWGMASEELTAMIITDGHHLPDAVIKSIIRAKGSAKTVIVSDASPVAGLPPGKYHASGNDVVLEASGHLYNPRTGYMVGSSSIMIDCMNYLLSLNLLKIEELIDVGFFNPLRLINLDPSDYLSENTVVLNKKFEVAESVE